MRVGSYIYESYTSASVFSCNDFAFNDIQQCPNKSRDGDWTVDIDDKWRRGVAWEEHLLQLTADS